jgi:hypothetical protein
VPPTDLGRGRRERVAVESATSALDAARIAAAYGGDTDTAAAVAAGVWCAADAEVDPAAWELPHLRAPVPRPFRDVAMPVLVPAVPWERRAESGGGAAMTDRLPVMGPPQDRKSLKQQG